MSIFSRIRDKIFGSRSAEAAQPSQGAPATDAAPQGIPAGLGPDEAGQSGGMGMPQVAQAAPAQPVDVEAVLTRMAAGNPQKLDWRHSIVDLMKLLGLESSLEERRELARELGYTGSTSDSASMNIWLHKQVMQKLAENGGQVPDSLKN